MEEVTVPDLGYLEDVTEQILFGLEEQPAWLEQRKLIRRGTGHGLTVACCVNLGAVIAWFQSVDTISELSGIVEYFKMQVY